MKKLHQHGQIRGLASAAHGIEHESQIVQAEQGICVGCNPNTFARGMAFLFLLHFSMRCAVQKK